MMTQTEILGVAANASEDEIRRAYLEKVKQFPPDRSPEEFERIRDAYEKPAGSPQPREGHAAGARCQRPAGLSGR